MSDYGLAGFANGFLQGYDTVGRSINSRRHLELEDQRLATLADAERRKNDIAEAELGYKNRELAQKEAEAESLRNYREAQTTGLNNANRTYDQRVQADLAANQADIDQSRAATASSNASTEASNLKIAAAKRQQEKAFSLNTIAQKILDGKGTQEDWDKVGTTINIVANPTAIQDSQVLGKAIQEAAASPDNAGKVAVFNDNPQVMNAMNNAFAPLINQTKGKLETGDGYVAQDTKITNVVMHPEDKKLALVADITETNPQTGDTRTRKAFITDGRVPVGQGGKTRWFTPEDVKQVYQGLQGIGEWQAQNPELRQKLQAAQQKFELGEIPSQDKESLDNEIKVAELNLKQKAEDRNDRKSKNEENSDVQKRRDAQIKSMKDEIENKYRSNYGMDENQRPKYQAEVDAVDAISAAHPDWNIAQIKAEIAKQSKDAGQSSSPPAPGATPKAQNFTTMWHGNH